jgi:hypothetical protein
MSGWLRHLVRQSRAADRAVRPATGAHRGSAFAANTANANLPAIGSEEFGPAPASTSPAHEERAPETRVRQERPAPDAADVGQRVTRTDRASPNTRDLRRDSGEEVVAQPVRSAPRRQPGTDDAATSRDSRSRSGGDERAPEMTARQPAPGDGTPRFRGDTSTSTIRPSLPARAAVSARAAAGEPPAPVPDVHIHIGRLELTALTAAPAPRRERTTQAHKPMSLDDYLRRRNGGAR